MKDGQGPSFFSLARWYKNFYEIGNRPKYDTLRWGQITAIIVSNIDLVRSVIEDNPYFTYNAIEAQTNMSRKISIAK